MPMVNIDVLSSKHHKHWNVGFRLVGLLIYNEYKSSAQLIRHWTVDMLTTDPLWVILYVSRETVLS